MANSLIGAVVGRLGTLTYPETLSGGVWLSEAPPRSATGTPVVPPYLVVTDEGTVPQFDLEYHPYETTTFAVDVYAPTLARADAIAHAVKYGGGALAAGAGLDFAQGLTVTNQAVKDVVRRSERRSQETPRGADAGPVFKVSLKYEAESQRTGA